MKKKKRSFLPYLLVAGLALGGAFYYFKYQHQAAETEPVSRPELDSKIQTSNPHADVGTQPQNLHLEPGAAERLEGAKSPSGSDIAPDESTLAHDYSDAQRQDEETLSPPAENDPEQALGTITTFYQHLDQQPYLADFNLDAPSQLYFSKLIQKLLDNPPLVSGETNDLFSILQNTAHFFRIVGRDNILAMKAIISNEKPSLEAILADFYTLSKYPDSLKTGLSVQLKEDSLCDYAGFFLTTMGGRLYLFRRDPVLRMLVSYYSILIVEEANQQGRNRYGIDIRPAVDGLINEIENSGNQLKFKEHYLDNLYRIKER